MTDSDCVRFLQRTLPRLGLRWQGFRKVRRQVCKRLSRRLRELELPDLAAYERRLEENASEREHLDGLCRVTISRFYRDRGAFDFLAGSVLPELADAATTRGESTLRCWSAGCASGEEPYSLSILWRLTLRDRFPDLEFTVVATDVDGKLLARAQQRRYPPSSLRDVPESWRSRAFERHGDDFLLRQDFGDSVEFRREDLRRRLPEGPFDLVVCRNLAFTYYEEKLQQELAGAIAARLAPGGVLFVGAHERLPAPTAPLEAWDEAAGVYRLPSVADPISRGPVREP